MAGRRVSFVLGEAIAGIFLVPLGHEPVSVDLGDDRSGGDRGRPPVSPDDGPLGIIKGGEAHGVDQDKMRWLSQLREGLAHGKAGGFKDIDLIDDDGIRFPKPDGESLRPNLFRQALPLRFREKLRIAKASNAPRRIKDHRGCHHGSGERAPPNLVHSRDPTEPTSPGFPLEVIEAARAGKELTLTGGEGPFHPIRRSGRSVSLGVEPTYRSVPGDSRAWPA